MTSMVEISLPDAEKLAIREISIVPFLKSHNIFESVLFKVGILFNKEIQPVVMIYGYFSTNRLVQSS